MRKEIRKTVQKIIDEKFLTYWEFVVEVIAPEIDEEEFDIDEVTTMLADTIKSRNTELAVNHLIGNLENETN